MKRLLGGILLTAGILIAGASGLCSLFFFVSMLRSPGPNAIGFWPLTVLFGGIPFAIGLGMFFAGRSLIRRGQDDEIG